MADRRSCSYRSCSCWRRNSSLSRWIRSCSRLLSCSMCILSLSNLSLSNRSLSRRCLWNSSRSRSLWSLCRSSRSWIAWSRCSRSRLSLSLIDREILCVQLRILTLSFTPFCLCNTAPKSALKSFHREHHIPRQKSDKLEAFTKFQSKNQAWKLKSDQVEHTEKHLAKPLLNKSVSESTGLKKMNFSSKNLHNLALRLFYQ